MLVTKLYLKKRPQGLFNHTYDNARTFYVSITELKCMLFAVHVTNRYTEQRAHHYKF